MRASQALRELYLREFQNLEENVTRYVEMSVEPRVGVGISKSSQFPFLLVLPIGSVALKFLSETVEAVPVTNGEIESIQFGTREKLSSSVLKFRNLSKAAEIFIDAIVESALESQAVNEVANLVAEFIELFSNKAGLTSEEIVGFFGELTIIEACDSLDQMIESWHSHPLDRFDFSSNSDRLEVKTSTTSRRVHRFSSSQLPAPTGVSVLVASMLTQQVPAGASVFDVYELVRARAGIASIRRLDLAFSKFAARDEAKCEEMLFDLEMAKNSLKIFEASAIPMPILTPGILSAKWEADLAYLPDAQSKNSLSILLESGQMGQ